MGLFSWVSGNVQKSKAAVTIQEFFEVSKRLGAFPGDPALMANRLVERAFNRVPSLATGDIKGYVLASTVLAIVIMEKELPLAIRDHSAMALAGMLKIAGKESHLHSYDDQAMLETARVVLAGFRDEVSSPLMSDVLQRSASALQETPLQDADTSQERQRRMDELIKRMK